MSSAVQFKTRKETNFIVIHCAATRPSMDVGVREIRQWHKQRGFFDIGYHYVIRRNGVIEEGRKQDQVGAHVAGYNSESVGICLVGGVPENNVNGFEANFTDAQMVSLKALVGKLQADYKTAKVVGHHHLDSGKACPSFAVDLWMNTGAVKTASKG
ncbi:amidase [Dickeya phage Luksen]|uniref:Lysozyme n=1 Tax=Dickeya phage Luksen TaxID=2320192 RepID=A0A385IFR3_9CAUD|nr:amidase [Dickeya phage Luksen]AXY81848.1 lysozyme [Dickeya phage Luksen]